MRLKLISYNIWHGTYIEKVIDFLKVENPDVVCLQEVSVRGQGFRATDENMLTVIQEATDMEAAYVPMFEQETETGAWEIGVAVLSRFPITKTMPVAYAGGYRRFANTEDFRYQWPSAVLITEIEGLPVPIATTHLPVTKEAAVTERQLAAAAEVKEALALLPEYVLCGDMNTLPHSGTYEILAEGLMDVTDHSLPTLHPTIHPVGNKRFHVDYVFCKGDGVRLLSSRIPIVEASDHLPVVVEFEV